MIVDLALLGQPLRDHEWDGGLVDLEPLSEDYREPLRAICPPDDPVWPIYPVDLSGPGFDPYFDSLLGDPARRGFVILRDGRVAGTTSFLNIVAGKQTLELGGTFMAQAERGSGLNTRVKPLVLGRAFAAGFRRVEFRVDERNERSQAAVRKLGAVREGVLRAERVTWTGHLRNTVMFSILAEEWAARQP
ncbi:N-acetyltransferase [Aurantiacibacter xanthus]|uniref:N-acetyltransferase n=1 Tax=Aurantiacibacter xanthus TaxID=1784712 RepID=A0A3A1PA54_9SPHN|nr:GNAT family protein [Aurantiacibacter xanthus]RIV90653.1 N-acetyltransferase [Aurantiacibacter xanthus]